MDEWFNDFVILLQLVAVESIFNGSNKLYFGKNEFLSKLYRQE